MIEILALACLALTTMTLALVIWNVSGWPRVGHDKVARQESVTVLIPARNEEHNIGPAIESALAAGASVGEVLVYDDRSSDRTADRVRAFAARDGRVQVIAGEELPPGWCGKNHACAVLARQGRGPWLLFLDADARLGAGAADRLLAEAQSRHATLISAWPGLTMGSFWERALMPMLNVVTFSLFPAPLSFMRDDRSLGLAHGACILVDRAAYERVGGHAAVRGDIFEDSRLAQLWRGKGERGFCLDGQTTVSVRMYGTVREIWRGFQKNFYPAFAREISFWAYLLLHAMTFTLPIALVLVAPSWVSAAALAAMLATRLLLARRFRHPLWTVLLHPVAEAVLFGIALASWWRCRSGRGVEWKDRRYLASA